MANLEDLKGAWQSQGGIPAERFDRICSKSLSSKALLQTTIFRRDMLETFASVVVVAGFVPGLIYARNWVAWSGFAVEVIVGSTLPFVLWWARKRPLGMASAANFRDFVNGMCKTRPPTFLGNLRDLQNQTPNFPGQSAAGGQSDLACRAPLDRYL